MSGGGSISTTPVSGNVRVYGEVHIGTSSTIITHYGYKSNSLSVYFNGIRLARGETRDYLETSPNNGTFTLLGVYSNPSISDIVIVDYDKI